MGPYDSHWYPAFTRRKAYSFLPLVRTLIIPGSKSLNRFRAVSLPTVVVKSSPSIESTVNEDLPTARGNNESSITLADINAVKFEGMSGFQLGFFDEKLAKCSFYEFIKYDKEQK